MNLEGKDINLTELFTMSPFELFDYLFMPLNTNKTEFNIILINNKIISNYYLEDIFSYITGIICFTVY